MDESFFDKARRLDQIIAAGAAACDYERDLAPLLANDALNEYFFRKLSDASWLGVLADVGKLTELPPAEKHNEKGTIGFLFWAQGEYLKKIAPLAPKAVSEIVRQLAPTQNPRVHDSILDIADAIGPEHAVKILPKILETIRSPYHLGLQLRVGALISALAKSGQSTSALEIAKAALEIIDMSERDEEREPEIAGRNPRKRRAHFSDWEYEQIITRSVPDLVQVSPEATLDLLCDLLDRELEMPEGHGKHQRPVDQSQIWRPAIEEHQQNLNIGVKNLLVTGVRDSAVEIARSSGRVAAVVEKLNKWGKSWLVFRRISLHVLRLYPDRALEIVRDRLTDRAYFDSVELKHEYFLLQKECFGRLTDADQKLVLTWIDQGPLDLEARKSFWATSGRPWTAEDTIEYTRRWKCDRLAPLDHYLDSHWKAEYKALCNTGQAEHPEFTSYREGGAWKGPDSPQSREALSAKTTRELVDYLVEWKPTTDRYHGASEEGLARNLISVISDSPERFAGDVAEFMRLSEPAYVCAVMQGFQDALKQNRKFDWSYILDLCVWGAAQGLANPGANVQALDIHSNWDSVRVAITMLLNDAFASKDNPIPFGLQQKVWRAIEPGTRAVEPTPEHEPKYLGDSIGGDEQDDRTYRDPFTSAINSPRGIAMGAVVNYALWVRKEFEKSEGKTALLAQGLEAMPEVKLALDDHLNATTDPSISIRSVYGQRAPWLHLLDGEWAEKNTARIFSRIAPEFWHAAWDTYIEFCMPYDSVFEWLKDEYAFAVEQIGKHDHGWTKSNAPDFSLAQHLMSFYWRGKLDIENAILEVFYARAEAALRAHALGFLGRSLRNTKEPISKAVAERLRELWNRRVVVAKRNPEIARDEMKEFGWWFASAKLDDEWSILQLLEALRISHQVEPDHLVAERLADIAPREPFLCVEALMLMVEGDTAGWAILGWKDHAETIIKAARASGDTDARSRAADLINLLGGRRFFEFGDLLRDSISQ